MCPVYAAPRGSLHRIMISPRVLCLQLQSLQCGNSLSCGLGLRLRLGHEILQLAQLTVEPLILLLKNTYLVQKVTSFVLSSRLILDSFCILRPKTLNFVLQSFLFRTYYEVARCTSALDATCSAKAVDFVKQKEENGEREITTYIVQQPPQHHPMQMPRRQLRLHQ